MDVLVSLGTSAAYFYSLLAILVERLQVHAAASHAVNPHAACLLARCQPPGWCCARAITCFISTSGS